MAEAHAEASDCIMKPPLFAYRAPRTLAEAVAALVGEDDAAILAGGQSLLPAMNFRLAAPSLLVDIQHIAELKGIAVADGQIIVKAMTRHRELELDASVRRANPMIAEVMEHVAHIPIRNRGTVVGSLCHADAAAEMPMLLVLLGGSVVAQGAAGRREIAAGDFFQFHLTTSRRRDEIIVEARFPVLPPDAGWAFDEMTRRHGDFAIAGVGAMVRLDAAGKASEVRLAACGIAACPVRLTEAENRLVGTALADADLRAAAQAATAVVAVPDDMHASAAYRRRVTAALVRRMVAKAVARAGERGKR
jgi:CO/xanthine dehydrogenase FAD-binding subunit